MKKALKSKRILMSGQGINRKSPILDSFFDSRASGILKVGFRRTHAWIGMTSPKGKYNWLKTTHAPTRCRNSSFLHKRIQRRILEKIIGWRITTRHSGGGEVLFGYDRLLPCEWPADKYTETGTKNWNEYRKKGAQKRAVWCW